MNPQLNRIAQGGLNENYAREIMELHTLGVDGGYTQKDVTELARVLTGWTITRERDGGQGAAFIFRPMLHDAGSKTVLGIRFPAGGGIEEGEKMIHVLAHHPATAHHIAYKLCQRLVADDPPPALVDRVAAKFLATDGDLRETVKAVIRQSRVLGSEVVSREGEVAVRVRDLRGARGRTRRSPTPTPIARALQQIGEPLYGAQPPTGYSDKADVWINTGALMNRLNFALALAANKLPGVHGDVVALIPAERSRRRIALGRSAGAGADRRQSDRGDAQHHQIADRRAESAGGGSVGQHATADGRRADSRLAGVSEAVVRQRTDP